MRISKKVISILLAVALVFDAGIFSGVGNIQAEAASASSASGAYESDLAIEKIDGLDEDFIMGVDVSSVIALENSGVTYYDMDGNQADLFDILADAGVNYIRVRVWNNPYDANGNGYGGGNCDMAVALAIGKRATAAGLKLFVDFHYSDFWADPSKQTAPKAWSGYTASKMADAISEFTTESLQSLYDAGVNIGMVQVGNETTSAFVGASYGTTAYYSYFVAGCNAVRNFSNKYNLGLKVAVHWTNPESKDFAGICMNLINNGVDFDVFATSYYPAWHGTIANVQSKLKAVKTTYGKDVMIAETAYPYQYETDTSLYSYGVSVEGQAEYLRAIIEAISDIGGIGVFYWEPAWLSTSTSSYAKYGTGWASTYSQSYDSDAAKSSSWAPTTTNTALFAKSSTYKFYALESLNVFKYVYKGTTSAENAYIVSAEDVSVTVNLGGTIVYPSSVKVLKSNEKSVSVPVTWDESQVAKVTTNVAGIYTVSGTVDGYDSPVYCTVTVYDASDNLVINSGFENESGSSSNLREIASWTFVSSVGTSSDWPIYTQARNAYEGSRDLSIWSGSYSGYTAEAYQEIDISKYGAGSYTVSIYATGNIDSDSLYIYIKDGDYSSSIAGKSVISQNESSYVNTVFNVTVSNSDTITVGIVAENVAKNAWVNIDNVEVFAQGSSAQTDNKELAELADEMNGYLNAGLTSGSELKTALTSAYAVLENPDASDDDISAALATLESAVANTYFTISVSSSSNGKATCSLSSAKPGTTVKVTVTPNSKYELSSFKVVDGQLRSVTTTGSYSFVMPSSPVTVSAVFSIMEAYINQLDAPKITVTSPSVAKSTVKIKWSAVAGATKYYVYRNNVCISKSVTGTTYTDTFPKSGTQYTYYVIAVDSTGKKNNSNMSNLLSIKSLAAPTTKATRNGKKVTVKWSKVSGATGYVVQRSTNGKTYTTLKTVTSSSAGSYTDTTASLSKVYYYRVIPFYKVSSAKVYGAVSVKKISKVSVSSLASSKVTLKKLSSKKVKISWKKVTNCTGYIIYRSTKKSSGYKKIKTVTSKSKVTYTDTSVKKGKTYYYKIRTYKTVGSGKIYGSYTSPKKIKVK